MHAHSLAERPAAGDAVARRRLETMKAQPRRPGEAAFFFYEAQLRIEQAVRDTDQAIARAVEDIERALLEAEIAGIALDEDLSEQVAEIIRDNSIDGDDL